MMYARCRRICAIAVVAGVMLSTAGVSVAGKVVGTTEFSRGAVAAQLGQETPRVLSKGSEIYELDFIEAGPRSFAVIRMVDDAKLTVRPNTGLSIDKYITETGRESADITLQRGGIRAASGRIAERRPGGMLVHAARAVVEVHGANFDARLCRDDCGKEAAQKEGEIATDARPDVPVVGRVGLLRGVLSATDRTGEDRSVQLGGPLYEKDRLSTDTGSHAVLVFRDGERITLQASSEFLIAAHRFDEHAASSSEAAFKLLKGGVRAMTGAIGARARDNYQLETPVATTGIRGTIYDHYCEGDCSRDAGADPDVLRAVQTGADVERPEGLYTQVIEGAIEQRSAAGSFVLQAGQSNYMASPTLPPVPFQQVPAFMHSNPAPRPDTVPVNMERLFGAESLEGAPPGVYVYTRAGHVTMYSEDEYTGTAGDDGGSADGAGETATRPGTGSSGSAGQSPGGGDSVELGQGETGYMGMEPDSEPTRVENEQAFMTGDSYPDPGSGDPPETMEANYSVLSGDPDSPDSFSCVCPM